MSDVVMSGRELAERSRRQFKMSTLGAHPAMPPGYLASRDGRLIGIQIDRRKGRDRIRRNAQFALGPLP